MPRPKSDDPRSEHIDVRVTKGEKARISERAIAAGMPIPEFVRTRALGLKPRGLAKPSPTPRRAPEKPVNPVVTPEAVEVAAEIEEAHLSAAESREAFIARRTLQLRGRYTGLVARNMAKKEWEERGT
jgi:hypothetical protein